MKIISIEDYFVSKFNEAQEQLEELKAENSYLKEELGKKPAPTESTESTESTETVALPELGVRYSTNFYKSDIKDGTKDEWAKAVESDDFNEIIKMYRTENGYNNMIKTNMCNVIIKVANKKVYCYIYIDENGNINSIHNYGNWLKYFETVEEAQEEIRRIIKERLSELGKEVK